MELAPLVANCKPVGEQTNPNYSNREITPPVELEKRIVFRIFVFPDAVLIRRLLRTFPCASHKATQVHKQTKSRKPTINTDLGLQSAPIGTIFR